MKSIIDFIYDSDVFCINDTSNMGKEYDTTMKELCEIEEALCHCYPDCYHILSEYISKQEEMVTMISRHSFEIGFRAGVLLMIEIISDSVKYTFILLLLCKVKVSPKQTNERKEIQRLQ